MKVRELKAWFERDGRRWDSLSPQARAVLARYKRKRRPWAWWGYTPKWERPVKLVRGAPTPRPLAPRLAAVLALAGKRGSSFTGTSAALWKSRKCPSN